MMADLWRRIPEPELMTEEEQACAYAEADFAEAHQFYVRLFAQLFPRCPERALVLDIGCGPGDVMFRFARAFPGWTFHGVDGSPAMLRQARRALDREPALAARVTLVEGLLPGAVLPAARYDVILSSSVLHHLHDPQVLWESLRRYGRPGAWVFICDLFRPESRQAAATLVKTYAAQEPTVLQRDFYNSLLAAFTPDELAAQLTEAGLSALSVQVVSDRHLVVYGNMAG